MRFRDALAEPGLSVIAEIKRRSPSAGDLRPDADPAMIAPAYADAGAAAISVLVDERFGGSIDDLRAARAATEAPLLGKGFFREEEQLRELREAGADAVLLLLRDLDDGECAALMRAADALGLDTLVEAHDAEELERALAMQAAVIGINARDLATFAIDRKRQLRLVASVRDERSGPYVRTDRVGPDRTYGPVIVAESGIEHRAHAAEAELAGADSVLIGSTLMRAADPAQKLRDLVARPLVKVCGLTRQEDVAAAAEAGADMAGFILARESPRRVDEPLDVPESMLSVAVFVGEHRDVGTDLVQLYERAHGHRGRDAVLLRSGEPVARVLDLPWEQEDDSHLDRARTAAGRVMLAGGLGPDNVRAAIDHVRPWAVDAARALEREPGVKDHAKVRAFVEAAR